MRASPVETLRMRQRCHDLRGESRTQREIQAVLNVARATVRDWLSRPRPTEDEIERTRATSGSPKTDITGQVAFKSRFNPELFARLRAKAEIQGAATNRVLGCAVMLYLDCMSRARAGGWEPVDVLGYRA